jgi:hypothetical protein
MITAGGDWTGSLNSGTWGGDGTRAAAGWPEKY